MKKRSDNQVETDHIDRALRLSKRAEELRRTARVVDPEHDAALKRLKAHIARAKIQEGINRKK